MSLISEQHVSSSSAIGLFFGPIMFQAIWTQSSLFSPMNNISLDLIQRREIGIREGKTITEEEEEEGSRSTIQKIAGKSPSASRSLKSSKKMIHFVLLISRQGKVRLTKWYSPYSQKERTKVIRELSGVILTRGPKLCNFVEWRGYKVVYKRYASLYFCMCIDQEDNELEVLEIIHHYVEILDRYFGSVCELDLIFNFHKAYYILDELLIAGELQESSKKTVARLIAAQDSLVETAKEEASSISNIIAQATK
ncbi:Adaptor protein complex, sigma subunit [Parasponia andersonii]|uniref:Adaptor AP-1 19 kDa protein n=1 Tax=Parasponia andersonii TaxID=3476 RepID=A0A2P5DPF9_PARAD|nr:Adaptor protein complex, sigma subunit [Parasponia andersonii]